MIFVFGLVENKSRAAEVVAFGVCECRVERRKEEEHARRVGIAATDDDRESCGKRKKIGVHRWSLLLLLDKRQKSVADFHRGHGANLLLERKRRKLR